MPAVPLNPAWTERADGLGWLCEALKHLGIGSDPAGDAGRIVDHVDAHGLRVVVHRIP